MGYFYQLEIAKYEKTCFLKVGGYEVEKWVQTQGRNRSMEQEDDKTIIYSEILKKNVSQCCYQSARLNDKYCVCGKAVEYPVNLEKYNEE